ncbi:Ubiquitin carboxyl-terminal hydrolase 37 [Dissostichus eleginoides]|uniref:Ubiquitin carboxyl-terminal hydrolase 37 n=1 Tax=Dissostichus eleginoides TaxID=100907 RepID=A0AAD9F8C6_DISEL|nr:Ubiquitin carboxyl-terminal hydrolase 37 [Dissostichus eleginoides]
MSGLTGYRDQRRTEEDEVMPFSLDEEFYDDQFDRGLLPELPSKSKTSSRPATPQETDKQDSILESHQDEVMPFSLDVEFYDDLFDRGLLPELPSKSKTSSRPATPQETDKQESILESHQDDVVQFEDDPSELTDDSQAELSCCSPGKPKETNQQQKSHQDEVVSDIPEPEENLYEDDRNVHPDYSQEELPIKEDAIKTELISSPGTPKKTNKQNGVVPVAPALSLHGGKPEFTDDKLLLTFCSTLNKQSKQETCIKEEFNKTPKTPDGIGDAVKAKPTNINCLGLPNLSNTCYMNSSLQSLLTLENFVQDLQRQKQVWDPLCDAQLEFLAIKDAHTSSDINSKRGLLYSFKHVVSVQAPEFRDYEQKDAHEFITSVLDQMRNLSPLLQDIATCMGQTYTCPVERNMVFQMENIRTCKRCRKQSRRDEVFTNLSLDLFPGVSVEEMLQEYQKETELEYKCDCGGRTSGQRSTFKTMPKVLILHLKRFRFTSDYRMEKLHYAIKLQSDLQVSSNEVNTCYSLVSTVSHLGYSGEGDKPTDRWLTFNDLKVVKTTGVSVCKQQKKSAYILFYKKQDVHEFLASFLDQMRSLPQTTRHACVEKP